MIAKVLLSLRERSELWLFSKLRVRYKDQRKINARKHNLTHKKNIQIARFARI